MVAPKGVFITLAIATFVVFLAEFAGNIASSALLIPTFSVVAETFRLSQVILQC